MSSIERIRWFLGELKRVKSGLVGFILLFTLIGITLAFPLIANPQDIANWSGHGEYWDQKMLPKLAPPAWINVFSPIKYPVTRDLHDIKSSYSVLNLSRDEDLLTYLKLQNPQIAKAIEQLPQSQRKQLLNNLRKNLNFEYLVRYSANITYDLKADAPPSNIIILIKMGPIVLRKGLVQGINILFTRPDGITISFIPGASANMSNPWSANSYGDLNNVKLLTMLALSTSTMKVGKETVRAIIPNTILRFSIRDYVASVINSGNPALINSILAPIIKSANESVSSSLFVDPMALLMSKATKGLLEGSAPILKGRYVITVAFLVKVPKGVDLPQFKVERARVLGVYGLMGTDVQGRDLWPALVYGLRWALIIGITVAVISTLIGVMYGVISGYMGGYVDLVMTRVAQVVYSLPVLPLLIILTYFFGPNIWNVVLILIAFGWVGIVFTVRSMVLQIKENLYVEAARAIGASSWRIIFRHVFPQILPYTFASIALSVPGAILAEAGLSFLGLGDPNIVTWGKILHSAQASGAVLKGAWWWVIPPGLGIAIVGMTFVFIGYALDRILNPRLIR